MTRYGLPPLIGMAAVPALSACGGDARRRPRRRSATGLPAPSAQAAALDRLSRIGGPLHP